jgi:hypothetical protein
MNDPAFYYKAVLHTEEHGRVTTVLAYQPLEEGRLRAVKWSAVRQAWEYAPAIVSPYLYDPEYQEFAEPIDRPTAERLSREFLQSELPNERVLTEMFDEGEAMGWDFGPPRE